MKYNLGLRSNKIFIFFAFLMGFSTLIFLLILPHGKQYFYQLIIAFAQMPKILIILFTPIYLSVFIYLIFSYFKQKGLPHLNKSYTLSEIQLLNLITQKEVNKQIVVKEILGADGQFIVENEKLLTGNIDAGIADKAAAATLLNIIDENKNLKKSNILKDQYLTNICHEIRTPLTTVIGFTDLLSATVLNGEQVEHVNIIGVASSNLFKLVNNILDLSKIESGSLVLENLPISISEIIYDTVKMFEYKAVEKGVWVRVTVAESLPAKVLGDQLRVSQVIMNLLSNAIKYTSIGTININCEEIAGADNRHNFISLTIKDTGLGIPQEKQLDIFERFTQASSSTQRLYGGTGLGLNIVKCIVDLYGGLFTMQSEPEIGTTFTIILPFEKYVIATDLDTIDTISINSDKIEVGIQPLNILLAEDNAINALLAIKILTKKGYIVTHVINGALALEAVQLQFYDLVLMDVEMPVLNGYQATKAIRALPGEICNVPIIAMTAHAVQGEQEGCIEIGMNGYVTKPFKQNDLFNAIDIATGEKQTAA